MKMKNMKKEIKDNDKKPELQIENLVTEIDEVLLSMSTSNTYHCNYGCCFRLD